jgi:hypothetical protein
MLHMSLWACISDWKWGLIGRVFRAVKHTVPDFYYGTITQNYQGDSLVEMYRVQEEPGMMFFWLGQTVLHHAWGGLLMCVGYWTGRPWLWRHGMLTEVGGLDMLDFAKLAYSKLRPPGPFPMCNAMGNPIYVPFTCFHHIVGCIVGLPVCVYFADRPEFQWFGVMVLGAPFFVAAPDLMSRCVPLEWTRVHLSMELWMLVSFTYQRIIFYFPATLALLRIVFSSQLPWYTPICFAAGALFLTLFNVLAIGIMGSGWVKKWILQEDGLASTKIPSGIDGFIASASISPMLTKFFVASKMIGIARRLKSKKSDE